MADDFSERYGDLLTGSYDCVDRVVLNAYYPLGQSPGGFRTWWRRLHDGSDERLDDTHRMRMAGRFARRVKAWAKASGVPVLYCTAGERKHEIAEQYLEEHAVTTGVFLVLAAKAPASVWKVNRSARGAITSLEKKTEYVYHYSFHIMDPAWGHMVIKMSGHPPWPAQVILNGHEYVAIAAQGEGIGLCEGGQLLYWDRGSAGPGPGRRCLVAACGYRAPGPGLRALDLHRLLVLRAGHQRAAAQRVRLRLLGLPGRVQPQPPVRLRRADGGPVRPGAGPHPVPAGPPGSAGHLRAEGQAAPQPGIRPARAGDRDRETAVRPCLVPHPLRHAAGQGLHQGRARAALRGHRPQRQGTPVPPRPGQPRRDHHPAGRDRRPVRHRPGLRRRRLPARRHPRRAAAALSRRRRAHGRRRPEQAPDPRGPGRGRRAGPGPARLHRRRARGPGPPDDPQRRLHHPPGRLRPAQLRAKDLLIKPGRARRYQVPPAAARTITALLALRDHVIAPILAEVRSPRPGRRPTHWTRIDADYENLRISMQALFNDLGIRPAPAAA